MTRDPAEPPAAGSHPETIVLIGPPAAGKTRIGRRLAQRLDVPYIDTDRVIVAAHGAIPRIFAEHGEPHFRRIEREAVHEALAAPAVVSLGGGAVLDVDTQRELESKIVVLLTVTEEAVVERIDNAKRPLITGIDAWRRIVAERAALYASLADYTIDTSFRPVAPIADEIAAWLKENR